MNKLTISILATVMLGTSLSTLAESRMNDMDMSKMPSSAPAATDATGGQTMPAGRMNDMDMTKIPAHTGAASAGSQSMPAGRMHDMDMSSMTSSKNAKVAHGVGIIKSIDEKSDTIVLNHQPIKELNWPAMSMGFKVADTTLLKGFKAGQKVAFELKSEGSKEIVIAITSAQ